MADDSNILSDDTKWFIQMAAVYVTLAFVFFRSWEKRSGRAQDAVTVNELRWKAQRLSVREKYQYTESEIQELQDNADNAREGIEILKMGYGTHVCPWHKDGKGCPLNNSDWEELEKGDDYATIEKHFIKAYEERDKIIRGKIAKRKKKEKEARRIREEAEQNKGGNRNKGSAVTPAASAPPQPPPESAPPLPLPGYTPLKPEETRLLIF